MEKTTIDFPFHYVFVFVYENIADKHFFHRLQLPHIQRRYAPLQIVSEDIITPIEPQSFWQVNLELTFVMELFAKIVNDI